MKRFKTALAASVLGLLPIGASMAQQVTSEDSVFYVRTVTCGEILGGSSEASGYAFVFLYGYASGEAGVDTQTSAQIEETITAAKTACEAAPESAALEVFRVIITSDGSEP